MNRVPVFVPRIGAYRDSCDYGLDNESEKNIWKVKLDKYRHMSFVREEYVAYKKFEAFERAKSLRTFLAMSVGLVKSWRRFNLSNTILTDLLPQLPLLRVLSLSGFNISEVPESIGTLRHLRYLNLSLTRIKWLPENVCNLHNLQTLILFGCVELSELPNCFLKLKNLRHLDIRKTSLLFQTLLGICNLKSLQITTSEINIGDENIFDISKLREFKYLCGKISIDGLEKVQSAINAREANFSQKMLSVLKLEWSHGTRDSRNEMLEKEVLNELKPCHDKLIKLKIGSYGGLEFPNWIGDPMFLKLKHVSLSHCSICTSLPPLAQLPSLKELFIEGLHRVEVVELELLGTCRAFPSLEILRFRNMKGWKKWSMSSGVVFPYLKQLQISECPNLAEVTLEALPSLDALSMTECDSDVVRRLVQVASAINKLKINRISGLNDVVWRDVVESLVAVEELIIEYCNEISCMVKSDAKASKILVKLRKLEVVGCCNLVSIGEKEEEEDNCRSNLLPSLRILGVYDCNNMERCSCPDSIEELSVLNCSSITVVSFPKGGLDKLRSVRTWNCRKLLKNEFEKQEMNRGSLPMLEFVWICAWPNLKSLTALNCLVHLTQLIITNCESLESFPDNLTLLKKLVIDECPKLDVCFLVDNWKSLEKLVIVNCPSVDASDPSWVWPPNLLSLKLDRLKKPISEWGLQTKLPTSLVELKLYGGGEDGVDSCSQISHLLPSSLTSLDLTDFEKLESVSIGFQHLTSLQDLSFSYCRNLKKVSLHPQHVTSLCHLTFMDCPNMMDLPELLLPSLLRLNIWENCPILEERCSKNGSYWPKISHIPCISMSLWN